MKSLHSGSLDAAFVLLTDAQPASKDLQLRLFPQESVVIIAARRAPMPSIPSIVELGLHPWVLNPQGCGFRAALQRAIDHERGYLNVCAEVQGYDIQLSLIARGVGLGLIPKARWKESPHRKDLKILEPRDFRLFVTPAMISLAGHDRFAPVIDLLAAGIGKAGKTHYVPNV